MTATEAIEILTSDEKLAEIEYYGGFEGKNGGEFDAEFYQEHLKSFSEEKRARLEIGWIQEDFFRTKLHTEDHLDTKWGHLLRSRHKPLKKWESSLMK